MNDTTLWNPNDTVRIKETGRLMYLVSVRPNVIGQYFFGRKNAKTVTGKSIEIRYPGNVINYSALARLSNQRRKKCPHCGGRI